MSIPNMMKSGFFQYMAEAEGKDYLVDTHRARLNAIINDLRAIPSNDWNKNLEIACRAHGIFELTDSDIRYINSKI